MFDGFRSRWTTRFWCAAWTAAQTPRNRASRCGDAQLVPVAELVDRQAVDVLHDEVGDALVRGAAIEQAGDVPVVQAREDLALGPQAVVIGPGDQVRSHQLHRDLVLVLPDALGEVHLAHAAAADPAPQLPLAEHLPGAVDRPEGLVDFGFGRGGDEVVGEQRPVEGLGVVAAGGLQVGEALPRPKLAGPRDDAGNFRLTQLAHGAAAQPYRTGLVIVNPGMTSSPRPRAFFLLSRLRTIGQGLAAGQVLLFRISQAQTRDQRVAPSGDFKMGERAKRLAAVLGFVLSIGNAVAAETVTVGIVAGRAARARDAPGGAVAHRSRGDPER